MHREASPLWTLLGEGVVILHVTWSRADALDWLRGYTRHGDWGGWNWIELHGPDGFLEKFVPEKENA